MATSAVIQQIALGDAASDARNYTELIIPKGDTFAPGGDSRLPAQAAVIGAALSDNSGTATVQFVLMDKDHTEIRRHKTVTLTAVAIADEPDGSSTISRATPSVDVIDLAGYGLPDPDTEKPLKWYVGVSAYSGQTSGRLDLIYVRSI